MAESEPASQSADAPQTRRARRAAAGDTGRGIHALPFLIAGLAVVLLTAAVLWWFLFRDDGEDEAGSWEWIEEPVDGVHARDVPAEDWESGWCLTNFSDEDSAADAVDCQRSYDVQVVLRRNINDGPYPGDTEVIDTAHQWCHDDLELSSETLAEADYELQVQLWHPTESTWRSDYDRMVSCFLTRPDGEQMSGDFMAAEEDDDADTPADEEVDVVDEARESEQ